MAANQQNCWKPLIALKRATPHQLKHTLDTNCLLITISGKVAFASAVVPNVFWPFKGAFSGKVALTIDQLRAENTKSGITSPGDHFYVCLMLPCWQQGLLACEKSMVCPTLKGMREPHIVRASHVWMHHPCVCPYQEIILISSGGVH